MDNWLHSHMAAILFGIEILWVGGIIAIIVFYLLLRRHLSRSKQQAEAGLPGPTPASGKDLTPPRDNHDAPK